MPLNTSKISANDFLDFLNTAKIKQKFDSIQTFEEPPTLSLRKLYNV